MLFRSEYLAIECKKYRVKPIDEDWLEWVYYRDLADLVNGAAGDGGWIEKVQIDDDSIKYRVHILNGKWCDWLIGLHDTGDDQDDFAGLDGKIIDAIEIMGA